MKIGIEEPPIFKAKHKLNNKNKLNLTVLLIPRLQFPSTKYKSLAKQSHDENSKEKIKENGRERRVSNSDFSSPFYTLIHPFPSLQNLLKIFSTIISKSD